MEKIYSLGMDRRALIYDRLDEINYRRLCDIWQVGDTFVVPTFSELHDKLFFYDNIHKSPVLFVTCEDNITRELPLNLLRKYVVESDLDLSGMKKIVSSETDFYKECSLAHNATELFRILFNHIGDTVQVVDVKYAKAKSPNGSFRDVRIPCFEIIKKH